MRRDLSSLLKERESVIKIMKKYFITFIFVLFFALNVSESFACSCGILTDTNLEILVNRGFTEASAVFSGKVVKIEQKQKNGFKKVTFKVGKSWKTRLKNKVIVTTGEDSASCGYNFDVEKIYLVYAYFDKENNQLATTICTRTSPLKFNKDVEALNKIEKSKIKSFPK